MFTFKRRLVDEIFRAYDIRGLVDKHLFADDYYSIAYAFGLKVKATYEDKVVVARDVRPSSKPFSDAVTKGLHAAGLGVIDLGEVPTPVLNYATKSLTTAGLMITGSHNPKSYNGLKMILNGTVPSSEVIQSIKEDLLHIPAPVDASHQYQAFDIVPQYIAEMQKRIPSKQRFKVVVDAGNGVGGLIAPHLYEALNMEVIPLYCEPDGDFPNHHPNPGDPKNLQDLIRAVKTHQADIGLAFDGDGDRLGVITSSGRIIWPDELLLLMTYYLTQLNHPAKVVYDVKCEDYLAELMYQWHATPMMWKTGHSFIRNKVQSEGADIGGEMSGHLFLPYFWYDFDDAFAAGAVCLKILSEADKTLDEMVTIIPERFNTPEIILSVPEEKKFTIVKSLQALQFEGGEVDCIDGLRVRFSDGWFLVRASNTTSALTIRSSATTQEKLNILNQRIQAALKTVYPEIKFN
ncbi:MAG: phosphomannomutase/phosphoglucomutase [Legionellales bacterium]|nr:phosphomannomutase/phosphoglucomutase [Legionellales bacterium]OUX67043.1 MAG: hypothetical protein CBD38_03360 [bacterium TMED178]|tara:strand:- start:1275 stop:2657 length:1383 start_codon:yes stop_codon:yes gene_type:complete